MGTRADLYRDVLENLGVVDADTPADAGDTQIVAKRYTTLHARLAKDNLVIWPLVGDEIPDSVVMPLVDLLSYKLARKFGQSPAEYFDDARLAMPELRRVLAKRYVRSTQSAEYF